MKRDAFDELFDRSADDDLADDSLFDAAEAGGDHDVVNDVLSRVDRHRSFLKPAQTRRVLTGRWVLSGLAMLGLVAGVLVYDAAFVGRSMDSESQAAGFVPVSGEVRRMNTMLRERISGLLADRQVQETDPEIRRRLMEARSAQASGTVSSAGAVILVVPGLREERDGSTEAPVRWDVGPGTGWQDPENP